ncbi:hypothetical protein O0I10_002586 [Lichtheimia ornata]|uniref:Uncharacterized protein n=1 Tax=Lichtheimia ornata TaxID=688661 RepID=A0AAD7Y1Z8_9FUNG|nr:uncharacterized protein O0I10_002586 [Lichtheimia ornata]KAJ8661778.1 hypothetical protein O0I10_002586 [Lichtheimia ornata]
MHVNDCPAPAHHSHPSTSLIRGDLIEQRLYSSKLQENQFDFQVFQSPLLVSSSHSQLLPHSSTTTTCERLFCFDSSCHSHNYLDSIVFD